MHAAGRLALALTIAISGTAAASEVVAAGEPEPGLAAVRYLPKDPLLAWAADTGNLAASFDTIMALIGRFLPEAEAAGVEPALAALDARLGFSLRDDFLRHLGPEVAVVVDLPPIDQAAGLIMSGAEDGINQALSGIAIRMQVDDEEAVARGLARLFALAGDELLVEVGGTHTRLCWRLPERTEPAPGEPPPPCLYVAVGDGALRAGFTAQRVAALAAPLEPAASLSAGEDFRLVAAQLDPHPQSLLYVNLPRIRRMVAESHMVTGMLAANAEAQPVLEFLLDPSTSPHGMGTSVTRVGAGARKVMFGPDWTSTSVATTGVVAAIAIPNLLNAINRARQKRTMADMRTFGTAMEMYAVDTNRYPVTDGWVECSAVAPQLTPLYVEELPTTDAWDWPLTCLSDGGHYVIVSPGRDHAVDGDYSAHLPARQTTEFDEDIVYSDGEFVIAPGS